MQSPYQLGQRDTNSVVIKSDELIFLSILCLIGGTLFFSLYESTSVPLVIITVNIIVMPGCIFRSHFRCRHKRCLLCRKFINCSGCTFFTVRSYNAKKQDDTVQVCCVLCYSHHVHLPGHICILPAS